MKGHINLGHLQKFLCHEECLKCDVAKRIWLEGKASLHWNLENNKRPFLSHVIDPNIKYGSISSSGDKFYDAETIDVVKELPKNQPKFDSYEYNSGLEKIIFYNYDDKDRNYRYFGNKIDLTRQVLNTSVKKRKLDSSLLAAPPSLPWSKNSKVSIPNTSDGSCKDGSTIRGLKRCGERIKRDEKPVVQETSLKHVLEQALKSIESKTDEPKAPSKLISREGVNFKGYHPSANHNELFEKAFGRLPVFENKSTSQISTPVSNANNVGTTPIPITGVKPQEPSFTLTPRLDINSMSNTPIGQNPTQLFLPFSGQSPTTAGINPFAVQFPSGRRRGRGRR